MAADRLIDEVLAELGFGSPGAREQARSALEDAGLTNPRKIRMSEAKTSRAVELLTNRFGRSCHDARCRASVEAATPGRTVIEVPAPDCENCGGSDNVKAIRRLAESAAAMGVRRIVVVGGSPGSRQQLAALAPPAWQLRLVDGTERRTLEKARADLDWAELVLVWGSSELDHRVSRLYTDAPQPLRRKVVVAARRGIAALLEAAAEHLAPRSSRPGA